MNNTDMKVEYCAGCGITLRTEEEREDGFCPNCAEDDRRKTAKRVFDEAIDSLNMLQEGDFEQDKELQEVYERLSAYFSR